MMMEAEKFHNLLSANSGEAPGVSSSPSAKDQYPIWKTEQILS